MLHLKLLTKVPGLNVKHLLFWVLIVCFLNASKGTPSKQAISFPSQFLSSTKLPEQ